MAWPFIAAALGAGSSMFGSYMQGKAQEQQQKYLQAQEARTRRERNQIAEMMMRPVYSDYQLNKMQASQRDILLGGQRAGIAGLNEQLAARGLGKSGIAEDLLLRMETDRAGNIARYKSALDERALMANRGAFEKAMAMKAGIQPAIQQFQMAQASLMGQSPWADFAKKSGSGLMSLGGMMYGQQQQANMLEKWMNRMKPQAPPGGLGDQPNEPGSGYRPGPYGGAY